MSILICEDAWHNENIINLKNENIDYIFIPSSSPARGFENNLKIELQWLDIQKNISSQLNAHTFFINRIGFEDGMGFWGGSKIIDGNVDVVGALEIFKRGILDVSLKV